MKAEPSENSARSAPARHTDGPPPLVASGQGGGRLELSCRWLGDRFGHQVRWIRDTETVATLASCEGTADDPWPSSPPWQQIEPHQDQPAWLTIGMAGWSHWSAAVHAMDGTLDAGPEVVWDIACRLRQPPRQLGHRFRWLGAPPARWGMEIMQVEPIGEGAGEVSQHADGPEVRIIVPNRPFPQTVRWKLRVRFPRLP